MFHRKTPHLYRADIDGLRAIAVIGVVLYHAGLPIPGGFTGVDIFFVISGFLITGILKRQLNEGRFTFVGFWEKRVRRIFPALAVVLAAVLVAGYFLQLPFGYLVTAQSAVALLVFASNIQFWRTTGYFDPLAEENPLLHTWSLSVEEQFYFLIPVLLFVLSKFGKRALNVPILAAITLSSFVASILWLRSDPEGAFFLLPSRAWELGAGCLLAFAPPLGAKLRVACGWVGLLLLLAPFFLLNADTPFPGIAAAPSVLGTLMVIWSGVGAQDCGAKLSSKRFLGWSPLVFIGLVSYSFYLWHWPFFAFHRYVFHGAPTMGVAWIYIALSFGLSIASWRWVERPFRNKSFVGSRRKIFATAILGGGVIGGIAAIGVVTNGLPQRVPPAVVAIDQQGEPEKFSFKSEIGLHSGRYLGVVGATDTAPRIMLWGDSHAMTLLSGLDRVFHESGESLLAATFPGTPPVLEWSNVPDGHKESLSQRKSSQAIIDYLETGEHEIEEVVFMFYWSQYFPHPKRLKVGFPDPPPGFAEALETTIRRIRASGIRVTLLREVPIFPVHVPRSAALYAWKGTPPPEFSLVSYREFSKFYQPFLDNLTEADPSIKVVDPVDYFPVIDGLIPWKKEKMRLLYRDNSHLTKYGAEFLLPIFRDSERKQLAEEQTDG